MRGIIKRNCRSERLSNFNHGQPNNSLAADLRQRVFHAQVVWLQLGCLCRAGFGRLNSGVRPMRESYESYSRSSRDYYNGRRVPPRLELDGTKLRQTVLRIDAGGGMLTPAAILSRSKEPSIMDIFYEYFRHRDHIG